MTLSEFRTYLDGGRALAIRKGYTVPPLTEPIIKLIYAQADLETGSFSSRMYREANNLFGMKKNSRAAKFASGVYNGSEGEFAAYVSPVYSIADYLARQVQKSVPFDPLRFVLSTISSGYSHRPEEYLSGWRSRYAQKFGTGFPVVSSGSENPSPLPLPGSPSLPPDPAPRDSSPALWRLLLALSVPLILVLMLIYGPTTTSKVRPK